jgi:hypothetical protein
LKRRPRRDSIRQACDLLTALAVHLARLKPYGLCVDRTHRDCVLETRCSDDTRVSGPQPVVNPESGSSMLRARGAPLASQAPRQGSSECRGQKQGTWSCPCAEGRTSLVEGARAFTSRPRRSSVQARMTRDSSESERVGEIVRRSRPLVPGGTISVPVLQWERALGLPDHGK